VNFFQGLGVAQLAALLLEQMCEGENAPSTPPDFTASSLGVCPDVGAEMTQEKAKRVLEKVDQLTEAEIDAMLGRLGAEPAASVDGPRPGGTESALRRVPGSITGSALVGLKLPALVGKTAIITGSSQGIGRAIAIALGRMGANVVVNYYSNQASAKETAEAIETGGGKAIVVRANVEDKGQIERLVATGAEHFGSVDIFIGNAASGVPRPLLEQDDRVWDWTMNVNARSIFIGVKAAIPYMKARGWGRVIGITSLGSRRVLPNYGVIGVSKAAIEALIRYFAVELAPHGICCNTISPGLIVTNSVKHFPSWEQFAENTRDRTPTGALVTFEQTAAMVAFLCSESASSIVGQTLVIDGGYEVAS
jgi:enoyl-[acyl-carrier protein] reductase III